MIGRLQRKCDFERVLAMPPCSRSAHFAVHHMQARPSVAGGAGIDKLCTGDSPVCQPAVDNRVSGVWLGQVLPKRHAPRSVTRNMLRRQVRAAVHRHAHRLPPGLWLVRLRRPFDRSAFRSADSTALRHAAAAELDRLLARAGGR